MNRIVSALPFLRSPADGSPLDLVPSGAELVDRAGRTYPIADGVPVLVPGFWDLLAGHYEVSVRHGEPHPELARPATAVQKSLAKGPIAAYFLGLPFTIEAVRPGPIDPAPLDPRRRMPGTLFETPEGLPAVLARDGALIVERFTFATPYQSTGDWAELRRLLPVGDPFYLMPRAIPDVVFSNYFEMVLFLGSRPPVRGGRAEEPCPAGAAHAVDPIEDWNVDYFRQLADLHELDRENGVFLDVGCGGGFLVSAFERLGARHPIGFDIRWGSLLYPPPMERGLLVFADMFQWCFAPGSCSFVTVRNNSAFSKAPRLDDRFEAFGRGLVRSLAPAGIAYLSFITDGSSVQYPAGFSNLPVPAVHDFLIRIGADPFRLMKLGSIAAFLFGAAGRTEACRERNRRWAHAHRRRAWHAYRTASDPTDAAVLAGAFLAVSDFASEVALEMKRRGKVRVCLWGQGILGYYLRRLLHVSFPWVSVGEDVPTLAGLPRVRENVGDEALHVLVDLEAHDQPDPRRTAFGSHRPDLCFFEPAPEVPAGDRFGYVSGDHDRTVPPLIAEAYLEGRLSLLGGKADPARALAFEASHLRT